MFTRMPGSTDILAARSPSRMQGYLIWALGDPREHLFAWGQHLFGAGIEVGEDYLFRLRESGLARMTSSTNLIATIAKSA